MTVALHTSHGGQRVRVVIDGGRGNVLTIALLTELARAVEEASKGKDVRLLTVEGAGPDFSYGASIEEHRRDRVGALLDAMARVVRALLHCDVVSAALVRGRCLGGGLELALACGRIVPARDARFGAPEIGLGVFAPIASALLPRRVAPAHAEEWLLSGRPFDAARAAASSLTEPPCEDPEVRAAEIAGELAALSASSLRFAVCAARAGIRRDFEAAWPGLERLYLTELLSTEDAHEGIEAFLEKRSPRWRDG